MTLNQMAKMPNSRGSIERAAMVSMAMLRKDPPTLMISASMAPRAIVLAARRAEIFCTAPITIRHAAARLVVSRRKGAGMATRASVAGSGERAASR